MKQIFSRFKYIIIALVVLGVVGGGYYYFKPKSTARPEADQPLAETPTPAVELATWRDEAGFSIQYSKDLSVNKHEEDPDNYAHLELTQKDHPGKVIVWVKDLPPGVTTLESWVKKLYPNTTSLDTTLGGEPAKKILTTAPVKMLTVGTISDNLLFYVEGTLTDSDYWSRVHDAVSGSFSFTDGSTETTVNSSSGGGTADIDEEEVLQ